jgi:hypothetical protein
VQERLAGGQAQRGEGGERHRHLQRPYVTVQVLPFSVGAHAGMDGSFVILGFDDVADPEVVFTESRASGAIFEDAQQVATYNMAFDHIRASARAPVDSVQVIVTAAKELQ